MRDGSPDLARALGYRPPRSTSREGRVALLAEAADLLLRSGTECGAFVGAALQSWLADGGDLAKRHLRVAARRGSHCTPARLYRSVIAMNDGDDDSR